MNLSNAAVDIAKENYFNAGVVIIDPNAWHHYEIANKWRSAQLNYLNLGLEYHDQCILNYVSANRSLVISGEFNYIVRNDEERTYENPKIVHFAGGFKPWHMPEFALWLLAPKKDRDLYQRYAYFQIKTFLNVFLHRPDLGLKLWKKRLNLRRTDSLFRILKQKWRWWLDGKRKFIVSGRR
jgi:lipopolysaccharide biosynthesis glycosyltransferase